MAGSVDVSHWGSYFRAFVVLLLNLSVEGGFF